MSRVTAITSFVLLAMSGCAGGSHNWELLAENQGDVPCTIVMTYGDDGSRTAQVDNYAKGPAQVLVSEPVSTVLKTVKVIRDGQEQLLEPNLPLTPGQHVTVIVGPDGTAKVSTSH